jgi:DNA-directed RNA polymerase specialized sigma24 family protein
MRMASKATVAHPLDPDRVALATAALLAADRQDRAASAEPRTVEEVLAVIDFTPTEVHALIGGNINTIKTRMRRARG